MSKRKQEDSDLELRNADPIAIGLHGFVETPSILPDAWLLVALQKLARSSTQEWVQISNATQSGVRAAVQAVFGTRYFEVSVAKIIKSGTRPQFPHADDTKDNELFGIVQLFDGQAPMRIEPYKPYDARDCEAHTEAQVLRKRFGMLLEEDAPKLCRYNCGRSSPRAGDGIVALPSLIHRGPGRAGGGQRFVLFFSVRPIDDKTRQGYDVDEQVHAPYLLYQLGEAKQLKLGEEDKVQEMYLAEGYDLRPFDPHPIGDAGEYEVEAVVGKRLRKGAVEYEVKWKNWQGGNTWEPVGNLKNSMKCVREFNEM